MLTGHSAVIMMLTDLVAKKGTTTLGFGLTKEDNQEILEIHLM